MYPSEKPASPASTPKPASTWKRGEIRDQFTTESPYDKLPDFPQRKESPYDKLPAYDEPAPIEKESPYDKLPEIDGPILGKTESPYGYMRDLVKPAPAQSANSAKKPESPYGKIIPAAQREAEVRTETSRANGKRPLPALPSDVDPYPVGGKEHIVTEQKIANDPSGAKRQQASPVRDQDFFMGRVISEKDSGGLILKSTMNSDDRKADTLIHLPESAVDALKATDGFTQAMHNSMTYGNEGESLAIFHNEGKWSYGGTGLPAQNMPAKNLSPKIK